MRFIFDLGHPAHFHLFKNPISALKESGHKVEIIARRKDCLGALLERVGWSYRAVGRRGQGLVSLGWQNFGALRIAVSMAHREKADFIVGTSIVAGPAGRLTGATSVVFNEDDAKTVPIFAKLTYPVAHYVVTPDCLKFEEHGKKHITHPSYHELAYLHPKNFSPDREILKKYGLEEKRYVIARFSALRAHHDIGARGISKDLWEKIERLLDGYEVVKSIEKEGGAHKIEPWDMHHILALAKMIISDSQTMTVEGSVLGIPSVRINTFVGRSTVINELENEYKLAIGILPDSEEEILNTIERILGDEATEQIWSERRGCLLKDKVDLSQWMIEFFGGLINKR